jgi:hypothetical protein
LQVNAREASAGLAWRLSAPPLAALAVLLPLGDPAQAQAPPDRYLLDQYFPQGVPGYGVEPGTTVLSRARPQFDPLGIRVGDFIIRPEVDESIGYNSNLIGQVPAQGTGFLETDASLRATSDWGRNALGGQVTVDDLHYFGLPNQNNTSWTVSLGGTYQIGRDALTAAASHLSLYESPTSFDASTFRLPGSLYTAPIPYTIDDFRVNYTADFGRISLTPDFDFTRLSFSNLRLFGLNGFIVPPEMGGFVAGIPVVQSYRDRNLFEGGLTTRYEFAPLRNAVLVVRGTSIDYTSGNANLAGPSRSGSSYVILAGLDYVASAVWRYRVLVGYEQREFQNYRSHGGPIFEGDIIWQPTGIDTVTLKGLRTIEDAADENVAGFFYTSGRLEWDHEYRRNILFSPYVSLQHASYLDSGGGKETFYSGGLVATWLINRTVHVSASYAYVLHNGENGFGPNYNENIGFVTFKLAM